MMKQIIAKRLIPCLLLVVLINSSCSDPFLKRIEPQDPNSATLSISMADPVVSSVANIGNVRTTIPAAPFTKYGLTLTQGTRQESRDLPLPGGAIEISNPQGQWDVEATAYIGTEPIARGSTRVFLEPGAKAKAEITVRPIFEGKPGTLALSIKLPQGLDYAYWLITPVEGTTGSIDEIDLLKVEPEDNGRRLVSLDRSPGFYDSLIVMARGELSSGSIETAHVYSMLTTTTTQEFDESDLVKEVFLAGTVENLAEHTATLVMIYQDESCTEEIGLTPITQQNNWVASVAADRIYNDIVYIKARYVSRSSGAAVFTKPLAVGVSGTGGKENISLLATLEEPKAPTIPQNLQVEAQDQALRVFWEPPAENGRYFYFIWVDGEQVAETEATVKLITGLSNLVRYAVQVQAKTESGEASPLTSIVYGTPDKPDTFTPSETALIYSYPIWKAGTFSGKDMLTTPIFDLMKLNIFHVIQQARFYRESDTTINQGDTKLEITKSINAGASAEIGVGAFSGGDNTEFSNTSTSTIVTKYAKGSMMHLVLEEYLNASPLELQKYLSTQFLDALAGVNDVASAMGFINQVGPVFLRHVFWGSSLEFWYQYLGTALTETSDFEAAIKASYAAAKGDASYKTNSKRTELENHSLFRYMMRGVTITDFLTIDDLMAGYPQLVAELKADPSKATPIDYAVDGIVPIYELIADPFKKALVQEAFNMMRDGITISDDYTFRYTTPGTYIIQKYSDSGRRYTFKLGGSGGGGQGGGHLRTATWSKGGGGGGGSGAIAVVSFEATGDVRIILTVGTAGGGGGYRNSNNDHAGYNGGTGGATSIQVEVNGKLLFTASAGGGIGGGPDCRGGAGGTASISPQGAASFFYLNGKQGETGDGDEDYGGGGASSANLDGFQSGAGGSAGYNGNGSGGANGKAELSYTGI